jgi:hypothetical protein
MKGEWIIDLCPHPFLLKELSQSVSSGRPDHVLVEDVAVFILNGRELKARD